MIPDEREWQAQERALHNERAGIAMPDDDALGKAYQPIAQALRQPPALALPADFANQVARIAQSRPLQASVDGRFERLLITMLGVALGISAVVMGMTYGADWLRASASLLPQSGGRTSVTWALSLCACMGLSWLIEQLHQRSQPAGNTLA
jgi:hypothetical protein